MKGMLLKELYNLKQTCRIYALLIILWLAMGIAQQQIFLPIRLREGR